LDANEYGNAYEYANGNLNFYANTAIYFDSDRNTCPNRNTNADDFLCRRYRTGAHAFTDAHSCHRRAAAPRAAAVTPAV